jgi:hypothetical protein
MVGASGVSIVMAPGGTALDLLGLGVGVLSTGNAIIGVESAKFGTDFGIGVRKALLDVVIGTTFTTGTSATPNLALQLAQDDGTGNPDTWYTAVETGNLAIALCTANTRIARFDWPPVWPETLRPRFARLLMQFAAGTLLTAGTIAYAIVTTDRDDQSNAQAQRNFTVA